VVEASEAEAEGRWNVRSSDPRAPSVLFLYFPWRLVVLWCVFCLVVVLACVLFPFVLCVCVSFPFILCVFTVWRKGGRGCCH